MWLLRMFYTQFQEVYYTSYSVYSFSYIRVNTSRLRRKKLTSDINKEHREVAKAGTVVHC